MKITFMIREDGRSKPGGDTSKVSRYVEALGKTGHQTEVLYGARHLNSVDSDIVHILNLDLPLENLYYAKIAKSRGVPVVLSTIRHPIAGMKSMYRNGEDSFYSQLRNLRFRDDIAFGVRERAKLIARSHPGRWQPGIGFADAQRRLIDSSELLLPMAPSERKGLVDDFELDDARLSLVPNGFTFSGPPIAVSNSGRKYNLVSVGRIEPRKNTLRIAQLAEQMGLSMLVVGSVNQKHSKYSKQFHKLISCSKHVTYAGNLDHAGVQRALQSAETYVNAAWFEVVSQSDAEASALGNRVLTTKYSYGSDYLHGAGGDLDPNRLYGKYAADYFAAKLTEASVPSISPRNTWDDAATCLLQAYQRVMA